MGMFTMLREIRFALLAQATVAGRYFEVKHAQFDMQFWRIRSAVCLFVDVLDFSGSTAGRTKASTMPRLRLVDHDIPKFRQLVHSAGSHGLNPKDAPLTWAHGLVPVLLAAYPSVATLGQHYSASLSSTCVCWATESLSCAREDFAEARTRSPRLVRALRRHESSCS